MGRESAFRRGYRATAIVLLNFGVMFLVVNIGLAIYYGFTDRFFPAPKNIPVLSTYSEQTLKRAYPEISDDVLRELLLENWTRPHGYAPFTQFAEPPFSGKYVNVHEAGFRHVADQGPWPPEAEAYNVFFFGGSTTFGYGLSDAETIPSYLQHSLTEAMRRPVRVYNFGVSFFYSTLERIRFQELLMAGFVPDAAVFLDGINDFRHERPFYTDFIRRWWRDHEKTKLVLGPVKDMIPFIRFVSGLRESLLDRAKANREERLRNAIAQSEGDGEEMTAWVIRRYRENVRQIEAIAATYGVEPVFVWQPMPFYKFDLSRHLFLEPDIDKENYPQGYAAMAQINASGELGDNFLWTADIQPTVSKRLYIDYMHYSAAFSEVLAAEITRQMQQNHLLGLAPSEAP
jgi:hypothetical protein